MYDIIIIKDHIMSYHGYHYYHMFDIIYDIIYDN